MIKRWPHHVTPTRRPPDRLTYNANQPRSRYTAVVLGDRPANTEVFSPGVDDLSGAVV
jgi:hypothetical protein